MSRYTGWSREVLLQACSSQRDPADGMPQEAISQVPSISSFTPINQTPSSFKPAPKLARQHSGGFRSKMIDNFSQDHTSKPKRRKTEPAILDAVDHDNGKNTALGPNQIPNSLHLGALPKSKLGKKKVTAKTISGSKSQPELFREAPITKSKQSRRKQAIVQPKTTSFQGFTTTEDSLKFPVKLTQTTLSKLASFKYNPAPTNNRTDIPEPNSLLSNTLPGDLLSSESMDYEGNELLQLTESQFRNFEDLELLDVSHCEDAYFADVNHLHNSPTSDRDDIHDHQFSFDGICSDSAAEYVANEDCSSGTKLELHTETEALEHQGLAEDQRLRRDLAYNNTENRAIENNPSSRDFQVDVINAASPTPASYQIREEDLVRNSQGQFCDDLEFPNMASNVETDRAPPDGSSVRFTSHCNETNSMIVSESTHQRQQDMDCESTEFDDNDISDEDLYAMSIPNELKRERELNAKHSTNVQIEAVCPVDPTPSQSLAPDQLSSTNGLPQEEGSSLVNQTLPKPINNEASPGTEDEFSMDEVEDEALMQFTIPTGSVRETRPPPSSLSIPFPSEGAESRDLEVYDPTLQYSEPSDMAPDGQHGARNVSSGTEMDQPASDEESSEDWSFVNNKHPTSNGHHVSVHRAPLSPIQTARSNQVTCLPSAEPVASLLPSRLEGYNDSDENLALEPFARPEFPVPMLDRSPVIGFSGSLVLRTCFRIGEAFRIAAVSDSGKYDILLELFARVTCSCREEGTAKQHFQFADLFHDRPPVLDGVLENYKVSDLTNTESKQLLGDLGAGQLVRCLGRAKRGYQGKRLLYIENIRVTDWEEISRTKRIVEDLCGNVKPENGAGSR